MLLGDRKIEATKLFGILHVALGCLGAVRSKKTCDRHKRTTLDQQCTRASPPRKARLNPSLPAKAFVVRTSGWFWRPETDRDGLEPFDEVDEALAHPSELAFR